MTADGKRVEFSCSGLCCCILGLKSVFSKNFLSPMERKVCILSFHDEKEITLDLKPQIKHVKGTQI